MTSNRSSVPDIDPQTQRIEELEFQLRMRETEIRMLKETADALTSQLHLGRLFQLVVDRARALVNAKTVLLPLIDDACQQYAYRAGSGENATEIVGEKLPLNYGICGWVWKHKRPWWEGVLDELEEEERTQWEDEAGTVILVPLFGKEHFLGGIAAMNKVGGQHFSRRDLDLLTLFASQVSIAIENAVTFEALEQAKQTAEQFQDELRSLNQDLVSINADLEHMALYDSLTGLPNRHLIQDRLQQSIFRAQRENDPLAILVVDLNRFKDVNDTLGHNVGDALLKQVGVRFSNKLRQADTIGRLGGDEFAVVIPKADAERATLVAEHLLQALAYPIELEGGSYAVSASMGIALYPDHGEDVQTLLRRADVAMYVAKQAREGWFVYDAAQDQHTPRRLSLMADLHSALEREEIMVYYQPKLDLRSGEISGVEALLRWRHPEHGMVPPDVFVPALEQGGLIKRYTAWILDEAIRQCVAWNDVGLDLTMSVNLSMYNLRDTQLPAQLEMLKKMWQPRADSLVMEVTESAVMNDPHHVSQVLDQLAAGGVQFSIDDFGTGYSSLSHLKRLSVAELKIDKSFVLEMSHDSDDEAIVRSTIDLAHNMGLRVVAEGVENVQVLGMLKKMGCDQAQGFYIAKPMSAEQLEPFAEASVWPLRRLS